MAIDPGTRLGPYEITGAIGAGGMGEVFRARDTKLNRDVAIKVLPAAFADDPERLARFTREAQTLASLNHPNIATIYGIEEIAGADSGSGLGSRALVMELVEGEDLSSHIARGPMPVAEVLPIARQIAEALEAAHEQGIVHRDLKPGNIKVRTDGTVKVLDFGLAKATGGAASDSSGAGARHASPLLESSPTLTAGATQAGMIIGTAAYMSPEQAKGRAVDKRADIWAFGVVLYEMLTGQRLFAAEDVSETLAAVLTREVNLASLPPDTPSRLRALVRDCLIRDAKQRLRDIGQARIEVSRIEAGTPDDGLATHAAPAAAKSSAWSRVLPVAAALLAIALGFALWAPWRRTPAPTPRKLVALIGADASMTGDRGVSAILSPDGATLAFVGQKDGQTRVFIRKLDQLQATPLDGTEGATYPFFSPDGQSIGFFAAAKLKKVSVAGGSVVDLAQAQSSRGGTWTEDDTIIFAAANGPNQRLRRIPATGGTPEDFAPLGEGAVTQRFPQALPGGRAVLYTEHRTAASGFDDANLVVTSLAGGTPRVVVRGGYHGLYLSSGHLVYMQRGTLFAAPFDLSRLETTGPAAPALEGIAADANSGEAKVALSSEGTLVHVPGAATVRADPIDWVTRDGKTSPLRTTKADWTMPRFSPDGRKLALTISDGKQRDIWVYEWATDTLTQLTFDPALDQFPIWTPDSRRIVFSSDRAKAGIRNLYWVNADGTGEVTRLTDSPDEHVPGSWDPGGKSLAFISQRGAASWDVMLLPMAGDTVRGLSPGQATVVLSTPAREAMPMFSPDGRWLAYISDEADGNYDVYVRPFPGPGGKWRVSTTGGICPQWSATARELLFVSQGKMMFSPYATVGDSFRAEKPRVWSEASYVPRDYDCLAPLHPDGKRLAMPAADRAAAAVQDKVVLFFNFGEYLKKIAPVTKP